MEGGKNRATYKDKKLNEGATRSKCDLSLLRCNNKSLNTHRPTQYMSPQKHLPIKTQRDRKALFMLHQQQTQALFQNSFLKKQKIKNKSSTHLLPLSIRTSILFLSLLCSQPLQAQSGRQAVWPHSDAPTSRAASK